MSKKSPKKSIVLKLTGTEYSLRTPIMALSCVSNPFFKPNVDVQVEKEGKFVPLILDHAKLEQGGFDEAFKRIVE